MKTHCKNCGDEVESPLIGTAGGAYCLSCYPKMPVCDDCDVIIEEGDYHLCESCEAARHPN